MRPIKEQLRCGLQGVVQGFHTVDRVLRPGGDVHHRAIEPKPQPTKQADLQWIKTTIWIVCIVGPIYGIAMGSFAWIDGHRSISQQALQMFYSGLKMPLLITFSDDPCIANPVDDLFLRVQRFRNFLLGRDSVQRVNVCRRQHIRSASARVVVCPADQEE